MVIIGVLALALLATYGICRSMCRPGREWPTPRGRR